MFSPLVQVYSSHSYEYRVKNDKQDMDLNRPVQSESDKRQQCGKGDKYGHPAAATQVAGVWGQRATRTKQRNASKIQSQNTKKEFRELSIENRSVGVKG